MSKQSQEAICRNCHHELDDIIAAHEADLLRARLVELDLLEQALNEERDMETYKLQRLKALTGALDK